VLSHFFSAVCGLLGMFQGQKGHVMWRVLSEISARRGPRSTLLAGKNYLHEIVHSGIIDRIFVAHPSQILIRSSESFGVHSFFIRCHAVPKKKSNNIVSF